MSPSGVALSWRLELTAARDPLARNRAGPCRRGPAGPPATPAGDGDRTGPEPTAARFSFIPNEPWFHLPIPFSRALPGAPRPGPRRPGRPAGRIDDGLLAAAAR